MMRAMSSGLFRLTSVAVVLVCAGGCFPSREGMLADLGDSRLAAYRRWRSEAGEDELLPQLSGPLAVADAVRYGLLYSPSLQGVLEEQQKAVGQLYNAYGEALPHLDLNADYNRLDQITVVDLGIEQFAIGDKNNYSYQLTLTQPLFKGGAIPAGIRGAKLLRFLSDERVRQAVQDTILGVAVAYQDVLLAEQLYEVQVRALEFAKANLADVTAREEAGVAIPYDRLRASVEVSNVQADMLRQRNLLNKAWVALFRAMGVSQKSEVELVSRLNYTPMEPDYEQAVRQAFMNRPELFQGELDVRLQRAVLRILKADYLPDIEAFAWNRWAKPDPHESSNITWDEQWTAGIRLVWPLFDGLQREGNIIQQKATLRQSEITLADTEQLVLEEVRNAILEVRDADELVKSQALNLETAGEALRLVNVGAQEGVNTELEVLDARAALTRAAGLYYQALHSHVLARLRLQRSVGMLGTLPGDGQVPTDAPPLGVVEPFMRPGLEIEAVEMPDLPVWQKQK